MVNAARAVVKVNGGPRRVNQLTINAGLTLTAVNQLTINAALRLTGINLNEKLTLMKN
jgi:hypothetical protein